MIKILWIWLGEFLEAVEASAGCAGGTLLDLGASGDHLANRALEVIGPERESAILVHVLSRELDLFIIFLRRRVNHFLIFN